MGDEIQKKLADECGLVFSGCNEDGDLEFTGTDKQWTSYEFAKETWIREIEDTEITNNDNKKYV